MHKLLLIMICSLMTLVGCSQKVVEVTTSEAITTEAVTTEATTTEADLMEELLSLENGYFNREVIFENLQSTYAITANTMGALWMMDFKSSVTEILISDNTLYFGNKDGHMFAMEKASQSIIWETKIDAPLLAKPIMLGDHLLFTGREKLFLVDKATGNVLWSFEPLTAYPEDRDEWDFDASSPVIYEDQLLWAPSNGKVYAIDPLRAEVKWFVDTKTPYQTRCTPVIYEDQLYIQYALGNFFAVDLIKGEILDKTKVGAASFNELFVYEGTIFASESRGAGIYAIDAKTLEVKWKYQDPMMSWITGNPVVYEKALYVPTSDAKHVICMDIETGKKINVYKTRNNMFGTPIMDNGILYIGEINATGNAVGSVTAFDLVTYEKVWELELGPIANSMTLSDEILYVPSFDGKIFAIALNF